jgi:ATP-dependent RNA helicase DeaD
MSFSLITPREISKIKEIERYTKSTIEKGNIPSAKEIQAVRQQRFAGKLKEEIAKGELEKFFPVINELTKEGIEIQQIAAALVRMNLGEMRQLEELESNVAEVGHFNNMPKMTRLFINIGKKQRISKGDILGAIAGETGIKGKMIGEIEILEKFSFVEVPDSEVRRVIKIMDNNTIKGKRVNLEIAKN